MLSESESDKVISMITDSAVAAEAMSLISEAKDTLLKSMELVKSRCSPQEYAAYSGGVRSDHHAERDCHSAVSAEPLFEA